MTQAIGIRELAKLAGCAPSTISKALNDKPGVSERTKERIRLLAKEHNFQPNFIASSLRSEKTHVIGLLITDCANNYFAEVMKGVEEVLKQENYTLIFSNTNEDPELEQKQIRTLLSLQVSGILAVPVDEDNYKGMQVPLVYLSRCRDTSTASYVMNDDTKGAYMAAEYLIRQGKRDLYFLCGPKITSIADKRAAGFKAAAKDHGLSLGPSSILYGNITLKDGYEAIRHIIATAPRPMGVFCSSDQLAIGALAAARDAGLRITEEFGLVGYDDIETVKYLDYPLTTIAQARYQIGAEGAKMMMQLLHDDTGYQTMRQLTLQPDLVVRST